MQFVPVISSSGKPLMPCHAARARQLMHKGKAIPRFDRGLFYIQLTDRQAGETQPIVVGVDPGSKREGISLKSAKHTFLNLQLEAVDWVKEAEATSTQMRRARRSRKTPYRRCRPNRQIHQIKLPPSTRARWGWKLRLCRWLARYYPISAFVVEDIQAETKPSKNCRWNHSFSPLEVGKHWFYAQLARLAQVELIKGYETAEARRALGLKKSRNKRSDSFAAHCVDSWVLANLWVGGHRQPDNTSMIYLVPLRFHRRQLHLLLPAQGGVRRRYGGTMSLGFKRGSWVKHPRYGLCYVGGTTGGTVSLHAMQTGQRVAKVKPDTLQFLCTASWRVRKGVTDNSAPVRNEVSP